MRQKKIVSGAVVMALGLMLAGCSGGKASFSEAPQTEFKELRDESFVADMTGAEIPVLALEKPIDFCYSSPEAEMLFKMEDGVWQDATDKEIPIDQERFQAMADVFLNLRAVSEVENAGDLDQYGLDDADHSVYITDGEKGEKYLFIGDADPDGNYYMTIEGSENIYTIKPEALDALVFDYDSLVVRDSLDLTASAGDLIKAVTVVDGKTVSYKTADTEVVEAAGTAESFNAASAMIRHNGKFVFYSWVTTPVNLNISRWHDDGLEFVNTCLVHHTWQERYVWVPDTLRPIIQGSVKIHPLITNEFRLENIRAGFDLADKDDAAIKIVFRP